MIVETAEVAGLLVVVLRVFPVVGADVGSDPNPEVRGSSRLLIPLTIGSKKDMVGPILRALDAQNELWVQLSDIMNHRNIFPR